MDTDLNKPHKVSRCPPQKLHHHFWRQLRKIKVMKCPPNYTPHEDKNSLLTPSLMLETGILGLHFTGHFIQI